MQEQPQSPSSPPSLPLPQPPSAPRVIAIKSPTRSPTIPYHTQSTLLPLHLATLSAAKLNKEFTREDARDVLSFRKVVLVQNMMGVLRQAWAEMEAERLRDAGGLWWGAHGTVNTSESDDDVKTYSGSEVTEEDDETEEEEEVRPIVSPRSASLKANIEIIPAAPLPPVAAPASLDLHAEIVTDAAWDAWEQEMDNNPNDADDEHHHHDLESLDSESDSDEEGHIISENQNWIAYPEPKVYQPKHPHASTTADKDQDTDSDSGIADIDEYDSEFLPLSISSVPLPPTTPIKPAKIVISIPQPSSATSPTSPKSPKFTSQPRSPPPTDPLPPLPVVEKVVVATSNILDSLFNLEWNISL